MKLKPCGDGWLSSYVLEGEGVIPLWLHGGLGVDPGDVDLEGLEAHALGWLGRLAETTVAKLGDLVSLRLTEEVFQQDPPPVERLEELRADLRLHQVVIGREDFEEIFVERVTHSDLLEPSEFGEVLSELLVIWRAPSVLGEARVMSYFDSGMRLTQVLLGD